MYWPFKVLGRKPNVPEDLMEYYIDRLAKNLDLRTTRLYFACSKLEAAFFLRALTEEGQESHEESRAVSFET